MDDKQKEQARVRKQRQRDKERDISGSVTGVGVTQCPAIIHALTEKREMLEKVYQSLKTFNVADKVFYGYPGLGGVPFDIVGEYLEATNATK